MCISSTTNCATIATVLPVTIGNIILLIVMYSQGWVLLHKLAHDWQVLLAVEQEG